MSSTSSRLRAMTDTRATRANRRAADRAHTEPGTAATRGRRGRPRTTEHRGSDHRGDRDASPEHHDDAESSHPSRRQSASSRGRPEPTPHTALLMAQELLRYRPSAEAHDQWLDRLHHLVDVATTRPAPSRSMVHHSGRAGTAAPDAPPPPPGPPPAAAQRAPSHASSPHDCQIVQRTAPDARVGMERRRDLQNRLVEELGQAGQ